MPRRSFKKKRFKKRTYSTKRRRAARIARARRRRRSYQTKLLRGPVNQTAVAKLRYCQNVTITASAGLMKYQQFRANGLYDPDYTGIGHQPMGFDELMAQYNHYTCIGSKINVCYSGGTNPYLAAIALYAGSGDVTVVPSEVKERQRTVWKFVPQNGGDRPYPVILRKKFSAKKFFHVKAIVGESQYKGTSTANPIEEAFFAVYAGPDDEGGSTDVGPVIISVTIEYIVIFSEPKVMGQS